MIKNSSAKINKDLELFRNPPYRRFFCHFCHNEVKICLECDHGHKYCPNCKKEAKRNINKKSNTKYRLTLKGKRTRAACENRRREKLKESLVDPDAYKIMGDPSTTIAKVLPIVEKAAEIVVVNKKNIKLGEEKNNDNIFEVQNKHGNGFGFLPQRGEHKEILCSYCYRKCANYSYDKLLQKCIYKKAYWKERKKYQSE